MSELEKLKNCFNDLKVKYNIYREAGYFTIKRDLNYLGQGRFESINTTELAYCIRLDTEDSYGHAEMSFFFDATGRKIVHAGYEG